MLSIEKGREPPELRRYRSRSVAYFDGLPPDVKKLIREQLLREQGYLCAYCMERIEIDAMKPEHWHSKSRYPNEQLDYGNMLGVCMGNEGREKQHETCDTRKKNRDLKYNPANPAHNIERRVRYRRTGRIVSDEEDFNTELNEVLNLNYFRLVSNRKRVWKAVVKGLKSKPGVRTAAEIRKFRDTWTKRTDGKLEPYCGVAVYILDKHPNCQAAAPRQ